MELSASGGHPYQVVAAALAAKIRRGELATDQRLPSLRALALEYGVTVTTAQRAVQQLASESLVRSVPNLGSFVLSLDQAAPAPPSVGEVHDRVERLEATVADLDARLRSLESPSADPAK